jgi:hypothetical protein
VVPCMYASFCARFKLLNLCNTAYACGRKFPPPAAINSSELLLVCGQGAGICYDCCRRRFSASFLLLDIQDGQLEISRVCTTDVCLPIRHTNFAIATLASSCRDSRWDVFDFRCGQLMSSIDDKQLNSEEFTSLQ